jgi:hypothetical protein
MDFPKLQVCTNHAYYVLEFCLYVYDTRMLDVSKYFSLPLLGPMDSI